ncbi:MAG: hypothetical protein IPG23_02640 [Burkholderiales bacterium]|jgi:hypothetical protein|nr:hypothetical protein [Burkholderiales bacterium]
MKVSRIYQPRNPLFWVMLALNLMSLVLGWVTHNQSLNVLASVLVGGFAIGNAVLGTWIAWRLANS